MRKRIAGMLTVAVTALSAVVAAATPAAAAPPWTLDPGGPTDGHADETSLVVQDPVNGPINLSCESSDVTVDLDEGSSPDNELGTIAEDPGIQFNNCLLAGFIPFEVEQVGDWHLIGDTYDATNGITHGRIVDIVAIISGPGCNATVSGTVDGEYSNSAATLTVLPNLTLTVIDVAPAPDNCSGLIHEGATAGFSGDYAVDPVQTITG